MNNVERATVSVAIVAIAIWTGGLVALGACAAPLVFGIVPAPWSGNAMGAVFQRFDGVAVVSGLVVLFCEAVLLRLRKRKSTRLLDRIRSASAVAGSAAAFYGAIVLTPGILALHRNGAIRGLGEDGIALERMHHLAEWAGQLEVLAGLVLVVLHVMTIREPTSQDRLG